jgi:hypothetical protein
MGRREAEGVDGGRVACVWRVRSECLMATAMMMMLELPNQTRDVRALRDADQLHRALIISLISIPSPAPSVYMIDVLIDS